MALPDSIHKKITPEKNKDGEANTTKEAESLVEQTDVNKNVDAAAAAATLIKLGTTAATLENNDGFQTPNRRHRVSAVVAAEAATAMEGVVETNNSFMALMSLGTSRPWGASLTKSPNGNQSPRKKKSKVNPAAMAQIDKVLARCKQAVKNGIDLDQQGKMGTGFTFLGCFDGAVEAVASATGFETNEAIQDSTVNGEDNWQDSWESFISNGKE
jgi:hypothetical protein